MSIDVTTCAFCGEKVTFDKNGSIEPHRIISLENIKKEQSNSSIICPFSNMDMAENIAHLTKTLKTNESRNK